MGRLVALVVAIAVLAGCSSSSSGDDCTNIAGTWTVSGGCGPDTCVVTQNSCSTNFSCGGGSVSYTGSVSGSSVSYAGKTSAGVQGSCSGSVSGATMSGTCTAGSTTCSFTAQKQ